MSRSSVFAAAGYALLSLLAAVSPACFLCDNEYALIEACDAIAAAVQEVEASCGLSPSGEELVCGTVCTDYGTCPDQVTIDECTAAIRSLGCDAIGARASYTGLEACADIFEGMVDSCSSSGDDDWDD